MDIQRSIWYIIEGHIFTPEIAGKYLYKNELLDKVPTNCYVNDPEFFNSIRSASSIIFEKGVIHLSIPSKTIVKKHHYKVVNKVPAKIVDDFYSLRDSNPAEDGQNLSMVYYTITANSPSLPMYKDARKRLCAAKGEYIYMGVSSYVDIFRFPGENYSLYLHPSRVAEILTRTDYTDHEIYQVSSDNVNNIYIINEDSKLLIVERKPSEVEISFTNKISMTFRSMLNQDLDTIVAIDKDTYGEIAKEVLKQNIIKLAPGGQVTAIGYKTSGYKDLKTQLEVSQPLELSHPYFFSYKLKKNDVVELKCTRPPTPAVLAMIGDTRFAIGTRNL